MANVYIGLGSNLGNREINLKNAAILIADRGLIIEKKSSILETEPVDLIDQPFFLNQVIKLRTGLQPLPILRILKAIEIEMGRKPSVPKGPRLIDLDILLYDNLCFQSHELTIPHPAITERVFIMKHLIELEPGLMHPVVGEKFITILKKISLQYPEIPLT